MTYSDCYPIGIVYYSKFEGEGYFLEFLRGYSVMANLYPAVVPSFFATKGVVIDTLGCLKVREKVKHESLAKILVV